MDDSKIPGYIPVQIGCTRSRGRSEERLRRTVQMQSVHNFPRQNRPELAPDDARGMGQP